MRQTVYVLTDDGGHVRYVGRTNSPAKRMAEHRAPSATAGVRAWVNDLRERGQEARMFALGTTEDDASALHWETWLIRFCQTHGADLLNKKSCLAGPRTDGARLLDTYIRSVHGSVPAFCVAHDLDRIGVQRVLRGERPAHVSVDFDFAMLAATSGFVPVESWASSTKRVA